MVSKYFSKPDVCFENNKEGATAYSWNELSMEYHRPGVLKVYMCVISYNISQTNGSNKMLKSQL